MNKVSSHTLGSFVREAREKKHLSLAALSDQTGISLKHLAALEQGDVLALPPAVYVAGMLRKLAHTLFVEERELLGHFEGRLGKLSGPGSLSALPRGRHPKEGDPPFSGALEASEDSPFLTPSRAALVSTAAIIAVVLSYVAWELQPLYRSPHLAVEEPPRDALAHGREIAVTGITEPGSDLTVNGEAVYLDEEGNFNLDYVLYTGVNPIEVVSRNRFGKEAKVTRYVVYQPSM